MWHLTSSGIFVMQNWAICQGHPHLKHTPSQFFILPQSKSSSPSSLFPLLLAPPPFPFAYSAESPDSCFTPISLASYCFNAEVISSTVRDVDRSVSVVQTGDQELSKPIRILSEILVLESLCLMASSLHVTERTPSIKSATGI